MQLLEHLIVEDREGDFQGKNNSRLVRVERFNSYPDTGVRSTTIDRDGKERVHIAPIWHKMFLLPDGRPCSPERVASDIYMWAHGG